MTYIIPSWCHTSRNMIVHLMKIGMSFLKSLYPWKYIGKDGTTWNHYFVGSTPMTHWFLYLGQTLWRDHMKSLFYREYSHDTLIFTFGLGLEGYSGSNFWNPILVQALHTPQRTDSYMRHISNYRARWTESVTTEVYSETTNIQWAPKTPIWYKQNDGTTWNHHTVGSIPMKYWFLYLGKSLWRGTTWIQHSVGSTPMTHGFLYLG